MEQAMGRSLDPLDPEAVRDPLTALYPDDLDTVTLQGHLGEVLAGLLAENYDPHGEQWTVPAFLFRNHVVAGQSLERRRQLGGPARAAPGRTGDDAVAFRLDEDGHVAAWLFAEAKCTNTHNAGLIAAGHEQLNEPIWLPVDLLLLVKILESRTGEEDRRWAAALRELFLATPDDAPPRSDMFVYVYGRPPMSRSGWLSSDSPHQKYTGGNRLEAAEVYLSQFDEALSEIYPRHKIDRPLSRPRDTPLRRGRR